MTIDELKAALVTLWTESDAVPARDVMVTPDGILAGTYVLRVSRTDGTQRTIPFTAEGALTEMQQYEAALQMLQAVARDMEEYRNSAAQDE